MPSLPESADATSLYIGMVQCMSKFILCWLRLQRLWSRALVAPLSCIQLLSSDALCAHGAGNLHPFLTEQGLLEICAETGGVVDVKIIRDKMTGMSSGYGFVEFEDHRSAGNAIAQLNKRVLHGQVGVAVKAQTAKHLVKCQPGVQRDDLSLSCAAAAPIRIRITFLPPVLSMLRRSHRSRRNLTSRHLDRRRSP